MHNSVECVSFSIFEAIKSLFSDSLVNRARSCGDGRGLELRRRLAAEWRGNALQVLAAKCRRYTDPPRCATTLKLWEVICPFMMVRLDPRRQTIRKGPRWRSTMCRVVRMDPSIRSVRKNFHSSRSLPRSSSMLRVVSLCARLQAARKSYPRSRSLSSSSSMLPSASSSKRRRRVRQCQLSH